VAQNRAPAAEGGVSILPKNGRVDGGRRAASMVGGEIEIGGGS